MSLSKDPRSSFWQFDFWCGGRRFRGSTETGNRREAEKIERCKRDEAKRQVEAKEASQVSHRLEDAAERYWLDKGQHLAGEGAPNTKRQLARLFEFFGDSKSLLDIGDDDVARLVAWRRGHLVRGNLISPFTVNDTTEQLKKLFTRAKLLGARFPREPRWRDHWLSEPEARQRTYRRPGRAVARGGP
jgi:hypothetical protein